MLVVAIFLVLFYQNMSYKSKVDVEQYQNLNSDISIKKTGDALWIDGKGEKNALIFYPGAMVEYTSYLPVLYEVAKQGMDVFLVKMPCNFAILGQNKAEKIMEKNKYKNWYIGGHSLGGAVAGMYASKHLDELRGLDLLAAYSTKEVKADGFSVLSIYGSEDKVLNRENLKKNAKHLPKDTKYICIEGGNHAQMGNYGEQKGDGKARISAKEQQEQVATAICEMIQKKK